MDTPYTQIKPGTLRRSWWPRKMLHKDGTEHWVWGRKALFVELETGTLVQVPDWIWGNNASTYTEYWTWLPKKRH